MEENIHPIHRQKLTFGQRSADRLTLSVGSWKFIFFIIIVILSWIFLNAYFLIRIEKAPFDPFPFILMNLFLSFIAAVQAPIILMSQNREAQREMVCSEYDYSVDRKAEREIRDMQKDLDEIKRLLQKMKGGKS